MKEIIDTTLDIISIDFFIAFGIYTFLYLILTKLTKKLFLRKFDEEAVKFISFLGIVYAAIWICGILLAITDTHSDEYTSLMNRMFGEYWFGFWLQPIFWICCTQLLRVEKIRNNFPFRLLFSLIFTFSFELIVIIITSFHRDYLPSSWTPEENNSILFYSVSLIIKIGIFLISVYFFYLLKILVKRLKPFKSQTSA